MNLFLNEGNCSAKKKKKDCLEILEAGLQAANPQNILPHYVTPSKNVRKEPRIDVSICHTITEESQSGTYYHLALQYHKFFIVCKISD